MTKNDMSNPELITMHCPRCKGGVEFPADGVGQRIACPHCQAELTLKRPATKRRFVVATVCLIVVFVAAVFGAVALRHRPSPAELRAMQIGKLRAKAEAGYDQAQFEIARRYFHRVRGVQTNLSDLSDARLLYQPIAHHFDFEAETNLVDAVIWYRKAAEQGL